MIVYIVRHTSVVYDGNYICYGQTDVAVRDTFADEAERTKEILKDVKVDAVFTSPLSRAMMLASYTGYPEATKDDRLMEMNFGQWELRPWAEIIVGESTQDFFLRYVDTPVPSGESQRMHLERVSDFIREKQAAGYQSILVFCHGGTINCARTLAGLCRLEEAFATIPDFGSVTELIFD